MQSLGIYIYIRYIYRDKLYIYVKNYFKVNTAYLSLNMCKAGIPTDQEENKIKFICQIFMQVTLQNHIEIQQRL